MSATFIQKLQRDLKTSPKKAAFLGLLCLVAVYFWAPLLGSGGSDPVPAKAPVKSEASLIGKQEKPQQSYIAPPWRKLMAWMEVDARQTPSPTLTPGRDPFVAVLEEKSVTVEAVIKPLPKPVVEITPQAAHLELSSTIVGLHRKAAIISGKTYHEGQTIRVETKSEQSRFTVKEIGTRRVVLERNGKEYVLKLRMVEVAQLDERDDDSED